MYRYRFSTRDFITELKSRDIIFGRSRWQESILHEKIGRHSGGYHFLRSVVCLSRSWWTRRRHQFSPKWLEMTKNAQVLKAEAHTYKFEIGSAVSVTQSPCSVDAESRQKCASRFLRYVTAEIRKFWTERKSEPKASLIVYPTPTSPEGYANSPEGYRNVFFAWEWGCNIRYKPRRSFCSILEVQLMVSWWGGSWNRVAITLIGSQIISTACKDDFSAVPSDLPRSSGLYRILQISPISLWSKKTIPIYIIAKVSAIIHIYIISQRRRRKFWPL